jgi:hypothetical protein
VAVKPKVGTWDRLFGFPSEARHAEDFYIRKILQLRPGLNPRTREPEASMLTTRPPKPIQAHHTAEHYSAFNVSRRMRLSAVQASTSRCGSSVAVLKRSDLFRVWWQCGLLATVNDTRSPLAVEDIWLGYVMTQGDGTHKILTQIEGSSVPR